MSYLWVSLGGALGTAARLWFSGLVGRHFGETFPWGTLFVNVSGSLIIGFFSTITDPGGRMFVGPSGRQFFMFGICGGYTTFFTFCLQMLKLLQEGELAHAEINIIGSVLLCLVAVWIGHALVLAFNGRA